MSDNVPIKVGDEFPTFLSFKETFTHYCSTNAVSMYIWDSQKIETARKRGVKKEMKEELLYYCIKFGCVKGGKQFKAKGKGIRDTRLVINERNLQIIDVMGSATSIPDYQLEDLLASTNFSKKELDQHYKTFMSISPEGMLNEKQFDEICSMIFSDNTSKIITKQIFHSFDQNNDGQVSFRELMTSLSITMKGTSDEKLRWLFSIYDLDNDGRITLDEVLDVIESMYTTTNNYVVGMDSAQIAVRTAEVEHMFKMVDKDSNGHWSLEEFLSSMQSHPAFLKMLRLVEK